MAKRTFRSQLDAEEICRRLDAATESFQTDSNISKLFEGKVTASGFRIWPTFDYAPRNQLRPEIVGTMVRGEKLTSIEVQFRMPQGMSLLLKTVLVLNTAMVVLLALGPTDPIIWKALAGLIVTTSLIIYLVFRSKVKACQVVLARLIEAE
ncbi:hypothetical protein [Flavobacterium sp.]|uniref:hypothetical protein n=1 Tax=Flavobacterium sp. TaxID=239 RepID=UPI0039E42274